MGTRRFCDICGTQIKEHYAEGTYSDFSTFFEGRHVEFCRICSAKVREFIYKLGQELDRVQAAMEEITFSKGQRTLDEFLFYY